MSTNVYDVGDEVRVTGTFTVDGTATDPTTPVLKYKKPDETIITKNAGDLTKVSTGVYQFDIDVDANGLWWYRFEGDSPAKGAEEKRFFVEESEF